MKRVLGILVLLAACAGIVVLAGGAGDDPKGKSWKVEIDNAFGLIEGGDFKVAGVRAGKLEKIDLDQKTKLAVVTFSINQKGFGSLREDVRCEVLPQSLVGEYYVDCQPGVSKKELEPGSTIPVERTSSTVPPDLVGNIMRRPYRERLRFIIGELGAAVAGNGEALNAALRRASPALRETNRVLRILATQNDVLADLAVNADEVVGELAENRGDVTRFVTEARQTAQVSASRDRDIAAGFRRLPGFLRELRPAMRDLGTTVDQQGPALVNLARSSGQLERLFRNLPPFARASRPAIRALGRSSKAGREAVRAATPTIGELNRYTRGVPELGKNLAIILEHLDDRNYSAEEDPRSPGGKGYTGLEALLQYVFDQGLAINIHDGSTHILNVFPFEGQCAAYADIKAAKELAKDCSTQLGPNVVGITFPDKTAPPGFDGNDHGQRDNREEADPRPPNPRASARTERVAGPDRSASGQRPREGGEERRDGGSSDGSDRPSTPVQPPKLDDVLPGAPKPPTPSVPAPPSAPAPEAPRVDPPGVRDLPNIGLQARAERDEAQTQLLEYLFGS